MQKPIKLANKNFLSSLDTSREEFLHILELAKNFKNQKLKIELKNKVLGPVSYTHLTLPTMWYV